MNAQLQDAVTLAQELTELTEPTVIDVALEVLINDAHIRLLLCLDADDLVGARGCLVEMAGLIRQRSVGQVYRLELERGLR